MTLVSKKTFQPGDIPSAAELNAPYDDLATATGAIAGDNTATGWITHRHTEVDKTGQPVFNACSQYNQPAGITSYNNTAYQTITYLGSPAQITLGYTPDVGEVVRFAASGMVGENDVTIDYDYVGANAGKPNFYAFRLLLNHTTGGIGGTINLGEWGYSFTTKTNGPLTSVITPNIAGRIHWQPFAFSTLYHQQSIRTLNSVELQCKVFDNTNLLRIERHQLYAIRGKR